MKTLKKSISLLLALAMILTMSAAVFADETPSTYTITISSDAEDHVYEAYQIFAGDLSGSTLSNVIWGSGVDNADELTGNNSAASIAKRLDTSYTGNDKMTLDDLLALIQLGDAEADSENTCDPYIIEGLEAGYYLVKDKDNSLADSNDSYTEFIVKVVKDVAVTPKSDVPTVVKKVQDNESETPAWEDSADYSVGDTVPFQLTATLANNVESYKGAYKVVFHDTLSAGLTFKEITSVKVDGTEITGGYTFNPGNTLTVTFADVRAKAVNAGNSSVIVVEYTAVLNENAVIGAAGNPNKVYLEYSNNPNFEPAEGEGPETGKTPEDKVIVFTYQLIVNKVDSDNEPLDGAKFTLYKKDADGKYQQVGEEQEALEVLAKDEEGNATDEVVSYTAKFVRLDAGEYKLVESQTPAGYNTMADVEFTITAVHDSESDDPKLASLEVDPSDVFTVEMTEAAEGKSSMPTGFISADIVNNSGAVLPETGGMGTTIFYVLGSILMIGAAVLLVANKRMEASDK